MDPLNGVHEGVAAVGWTVGPVVGAALIATVEVEQSFRAPFVLLLIASGCVAAMRVGDAAPRARLRHARRPDVRAGRRRFRYRSATRCRPEAAGTRRAGHGGSHLSHPGAGTTTVVRRGVRASEPQGVTFVELFFDLVFVFAVTQVTARTASDLTASGVLRSVLVGWLIWWAWTQFTWTLNPADTTHEWVRILTLVATAAAFVMAASVPRAFTDEAIWFALPYLAVRLLGLGLQVRVEMERKGADHVAVYRWAGASLVGLALVLAGALVDPGLRSFVWLAAIGADFAAATIAGRAATWDLDPRHLAERHGLFVIIALGESLIVAGTAISDAELDAGLVTAVGASIVVACLLWWTYFGWLKDALERRFAAADPHRLGPLARDAFSFAHFPLIGGIVGFAVAVEETVVHPDDPMTVPVLAALAVGVVLFVASSALSLRILAGPILVARLAALVAMSVALVAAGMVAAPPVVPLGIVAAALLAIVIMESVRPPDRSPAAEPTSAGEGSSA